MATRVFRLLLTIWLGVNVAYPKLAIIPFGKRMGLEDRAPNLRIRIDEELCKATQCEGAFGIFKLD